MKNLPLVSETGKAPELDRFRAAERWLMKTLRRAIDRADEVLHRWEVEIRKDGEACHGAQSVAVKSNSTVLAEPIETETESWRGTLTEQDGNASVPTKRRPSKKRRMTAAEFDLDIRMRSAARAGAR